MILLDAFCIGRDTTTTRSETTRRPRFGMLAEHQSKASYQSGANDERANATSSSTG
jgi:hypothetical protein